MVKEKYYGILGKKAGTMSLFLLWAGIVGGILLRSVLILSRINTSWASMAWYSSMILFIYFYGYRVYIEGKRQEIIIKSNLREKLNKGRLSKEDMESISRIIDSVAVSKVKWNHLFFLIMSIIFLIGQAVIDIIGIA